ncbi:hypothetical protein CPT_Sycamore_053 [Streptomyces phage Sycamore]|uniref:Uncharacterized protein n=1 Tax=Streptomyces phage Sycamore TaxID=2767589 RepID=A0A873WGX8_9CAUD|nr:hypothetical protein CPT_Sycamore_053 [Streptomyces phage Sycamore]
MDLYVKPLFGIKDVSFEAATPDDEPKAVVTLEGQGGLIFRVHMEPSEWRWLAIDLHKKKEAEDERLGE